MRHDRRVLRLPATNNRQTWPRRILVGVDFRQPSLAAANWAATQFGAGAAIELAHVLPIAEVPGFLRPLMPALDDRLEAATARPLQGLRGFAETLEAKHLSVQMRVGPPGRRAPRAGQKFRADLVGTRPDHWERNQGSHGRASRPTTLRAGADRGWRRPKSGRGASSRRSMMPRSGPRWWTGQLRSRDTSTRSSPSCTSSARRFWRTSGSRKAARKTAMGGWTRALARSS